MIYLFLALLSYACTYYLTGLLIQGQLADVAEGLRHRQYALLAGSALAVLVCLAASWFC
jgi:hypothetical protein